MVAQPSRGAAKLQRVPFLPDLLDPVLASSSVEELHGLLAQLDLRHAEVLAELDTARRLTEDLPGGGGGPPLWVTCTRHVHAAGAQPGAVHVAWVQSGARRVEVWASLCGGVASEC